MGQGLNPYTPGSGIKSLKLAGRDGELEAFSVLLERLASGQHERNLVYSGKDLVYSPRRGLIDFTVPLFGGVSAGTASVGQLRG